MSSFISTSRHQRVYGTVGVFSKRIHDAKREEEEKPELWFVVVPDRVWKYCRPKSVVEPELRQQALKAFTKPKAAKTFYETRALFPEMEQDATPYVYEEQFHNQLKARLLDDMVLTQIIKESTLANIGNPVDPGVDRRQAARQSEIAWNLCTAVFYKVGGRPWKVAEYPRRRVLRGPGVQEGRDNGQPEKCLLRRTDVSGLRRRSCLQRGAWALVQR